MVEGDLVDLTLPSLLHALAREGSTVVLRLRCSTSHGAVHFYEGTLVHAYAGESVGDEAMYELLGWPEGRFRLTRDTDAQPRTITPRLANIVTAVTPGRGNGHGPVNGTPIKTGNSDEQLLHDLLTQLTRLEQDRVQLEEGRVEGGTVAALLLITAVVNSMVAAVIARCSDPDVLPSRVLARLAEEHPYTQLLGEDMNRISITTAADVLKTCEGEAHKSEPLYLNLCRALIDVLTFYGNAASTLFRSNREREEWRATFGVFVDGLWTAIRDVKVLT
jgi:hypothetical protein